MVGAEERGGEGAEGEGEGRGGGRRRRAYSKQRAPLSTVRGREGGENGERKEEGIGGEDIVFFLSRFLFTTSHFFIM